VSFNLNNQKKGGGGVPQDLIEVGTIPGRVVRIIDLGLQPGGSFEGKDKPNSYQVDVTYELSDVFMKDKDGNEDETKPRWISESFPMHHPSADLAKSTKRCNAFDPKHEHNYDLGKMIGAPVMITIVHKTSKGKTYANVGNVSVMRDKDAAKCPELKNESIVFTLDDPDLEIFNKFPDWLKDKIKGNLEFKGSKLDILLSGGDAKQKEVPQETEQGTDEEEGEEW